LSTPKIPSWSAPDGLLDFLATRPHLDLFLDFDGTLTEIAGHPDHARMGKATRALLLELVARPRTKVALVSGRRLDGLIKLLDQPEVGLVGIHGLEWRRADVRSEHEAATRVRPAIARIADAIADEVAATPGAVLEQKGSSISLHLRAAATARATHLRERLLALCAAEPDVYTHGGSGVVEVRPVGGPTKGTAILEFLIAEHGPDWAARTAAVFVGDDVTDEDGFVALRDRGAGVIVVPPGSVRRPTAARWRAGSIADVHHMLEAIRDYGRTT
jgi:trehalose 6-phosphate phosphatase